MKSTFKLKPEDELIICCARTQIDPVTAKKIKYLIKKDLKWDYLIDSALTHSLRSLLYYQLSRISPDDVPEYVMDDLREHYNRNVRKNLFMLGELLKILKLLELEGITAVPYKGPTMAINVYRNLSLREFSDLDILIDKKDVMKVKEILISSGFETKLKFNKEREIQYIKSQREYHFINKEKGLSAEIQWNLADLRLSFPQMDVFTINQFKIGHTKINNQTMSCFSNEDLLLILCIHTVTHLWGKFSWICDIAELIKSSDELNWEKIIANAQYMAMERIVYLNLALVSELFNIELPPDISRRIESDKKVESLKQDIIRIIFDSENYSFLKRVFLQFRLREKRISKINDFVRHLTIPTSTEWEMFQKPIPLKILYILARPIQIFNKALK